MDIRNDRRTQFVIGGAVLALLAGLGIGWALMSGHKGQTAPPPASAGGLVIDSGFQDDGKVDPASTLRCFVAGQFVGEFTLAECAKRNGVATGALDVGVDDTGALAAAEQAGTVLTPLPPVDATLAPEAKAAPTAAETPSLGGAIGGCWRYGEGQWRRLPSDVPLNACAQALFAGRCERQGGATYGRWMQQTLRLVPGRVEVSADNQTFRTLMEQGAGCSLPTG
ncbi:MAG: hypothetical protein JWO33_81 [Caulobacteraceae bacterium]|nr:hypothetical protein [Caulobacteraceae bacterium]